MTKLEYSFFTWMNFPYPQPNAQAGIIHNDEHNTTHIPKKRKFTKEEDNQLIYLYKKYNGNFSIIAACMNKYTKRQCKDRYEKYLSPHLNRGPFTKSEDRLLIQKQKELGCKWVKIKQFFCNRTDADLKNRWQLLARKNLVKNLCGHKNTISKKNRHLLCMMNDSDGNYLYMNHSRKQKAKEVKQEESPPDTTERSLDDIINECFPSFVESCFDNESIDLLF